MLTSDCAHLLKELGSIDTPDSPLTYNKTNKLKHIKSQRNPAHIEKTLTLPKINNKLTHSISLIDVKSPKIKISPSFQVKYKSHNPTRSEALPDETDDSRPKSIFLTLNENETLAKLVRKKMQKKPADADLAELEFKYQRVLERHSTHLERRDRILKNIRRKSQAIESQQLAAGEKIRGSLEQETASYEKSIRHTRSKFRRRERVLKSLGVHYTKIWDEANVDLGALSIPKYFRPRFIDVQSGEAKYEQ